MKKILNEWRNFVISERKTDAFYENIINFFIDTIIQNAENFYYIINYDSKEVDWQIYFPNEAGTKTWKDNFLFGMTPISHEKIKESYKKFSSSQEQEILPDQEKFFDFFSKLRIAFVSSAERNAGADMSNTGLMRLFIPLEREAWQKRAEITGGYNKESIRILKYYSIHSRAIIEHELTHWINSFRSTHRSFRTSGEGKNTIHTFNPEKDGGKWYANSTEEMQARLIPLYMELKTRLLNDDSEIVSLVKKTGTDFVKTLLKTKKQKDDGVFGDDLYIKDFDSKDLLKQRPSTNSSTLLKPDKLKKLIQRLLEVREQLQQYVK